MANYKKRISIIICIVFITGLTITIGITKYMEHKEIFLKKLSTNSNLVWKFS